MRRKQIEENMLLRARIKELENIICPGEQHDYAKVSEESTIIDEYGACVYHRRYVCKRCLKAIEKTELI